MTEPLTEFPSHGVCWKPNALLLNHLKNRSNNQSGMSINGNDLAHKGLAWNLTGMWVVANKSSQPEYSIEELMRHIPLKIPDNLVGYPMTPAECFQEEIKPGDEIIVDSPDDVIHGIKGIVKEIFFDKHSELIMVKFKEPLPDYPGGGGLAATPLKKVKLVTHVLTSKQISNTLNPEENGKHQEGESSIKVCRSNLSVRRGEDIRATTVRCPKGKIRFGSSDS